MGIQTRWLDRDERERVVGWMVARRGPEMETAERLLIPDGWTMGAFQEERLIAAGAVFPSIPGGLGFLGKVIANPDESATVTAAAFRPLLRAMMEALWRTGCPLAVSAFSEDSLAALAAGRGGSFQRANLVFHIGEG